MAQILTEAQILAVDSAAREYNAANLEVVIRCNKNSYTFGMRAWKSDVHYKVFKLFDCVVNASVATQIVDEIERHLDYLIEHSERL